MQHASLQISKKRKQVALWVYPEGQVLGALFVSHHTKRARREEEPLDVLNHPAPFVIVRCYLPDEIRFYNKAAIVRIEYVDEGSAALAPPPSLPCQLHLMDGSLIVASIRQHRPPERSRLYDGLNVADERFVKVHLEDGAICLVNKSYIVAGIGLTEQASGRRMVHQSRNIIL
jgi:hypothetical protein